MHADPDAEVERALAEGRRPIRTLGFDAPRGHLIAAGFQPVRLVAPRLAQTPRADAILGAAEIGPRGRRLLEALLGSHQRNVPILVTQADAEQPQIFAALRELGRLGEPVPQHVHFCDLLHIDRPASRAYTAARLAQLDDWLVSLGGCQPDTAALADAAALLARQDAQLARLSALRRERRIAGSSALEVIAAAAILPAAEHEQALARLLSADNPPLPGTAVFVCGSAHEGPEVYRAIEAAGGLVVGEDHAWGMDFGASAPVPPRVADAGARAANAAAQAGACGAELVLHLSLDGDEAAPWDVAQLRAVLEEPLIVSLSKDGEPSAAPASFDSLRMSGVGLTHIRFAALRGPSQPDPAFAVAVIAAVAGTPAVQAAPRVGTEAPRPAAPPLRSRKALSSTGDVNAYQRDWFAALREQVAAGAPFAMVNANAPQEILRALDIPFVVNQWWASIVAAKQQSRRYQALLREHGYPSDVEAYSAQGLAACFDDDAANAPWGGLPRPDFVHAVASSDPTLKIFAQWAEETGADCYVYERTTDPRPGLFSDWWARLHRDWDTALEATRIDLLVAEMREVIARLEAKTGRTFSLERLREVMELVNEQEEYYRKTRDLVARTVPAPIGLVDSMPATMVPQWHRGTVWARDAAKAFFDEVKSRVDAGLGACPNERVRLMWVGRGLWSEMGFYQKWEDSHGAVFIWSMYLALAADGYIRDLSGGRDPLRALASRVICMGDELRMPTWAGPWHVHEAQTHQIDAAVALQDADPFVVRALRAAGVPVLELTADNFNREGEDAAGIEAAITAFIEGPASQRAEAREMERRVGA
jgi:benzoyl-CoA reductase/2-hydroxyglutaryl-CoA dehydratase subunit BcrC/BadD/HgdB